MIVVSIICPTYNSVMYLADTIESIINQTYSNWELLITDDCSTDITWQLLQEYANKDKRIKVFQLTKNSGPGIARNNSIQHSTGRFIAFCDSDDQWLQNKLEKQINFMLEKDCALSFSSYKIIDEVGIPQGYVQAKTMVDYSTMLKNNYIGCLTAIYDTNKIGKLLLEDIRKRQDWALWLSILKKTDKAYGIIDPLAIYRKRSNSISSNKIALLKYHWVIYNEIEGFSKLKSCFLLIQYLFFYFKK